MKNIKIAVIYGRSIEGCGVTKGGKEMEIWAKKHDVQLDIFSYDVWSYIRKGTHNIHTKSFGPDDLTSLSEKINSTYDIVVFQSYPINKFNNSDISKFYFEFVRKLTKPVLIGFMHELTKMNVGKIAYSVPIMNHMDIIYNFSETTWFSQNISSILPSKKLGERVKKFTMWTNFETLVENFKNKYPLESKKKGLVYVGRWTTMKSPRRVIDIGVLLQKQDPNFFVELRGIEASIGAKFDIMDHPDSTYHKENKFAPTRLIGNGQIHVYGSYEYDFGMNFLAENLFGASFYAMPNAPKDYGDRMEYTQIETIAVGTIPLFDTHWGENNRTKTGERYIDIPYSAIYSDKGDLGSTVNTLLEVSADIEKQKRFRNVGMELINSEFNADTVLPEMFESALALGKDTGKFETDQDLIFGITNNKDFVKDVDELINKNEIPILGIKQLKGNLLSVLDVKKEKVLKEYNKIPAKKNSFTNLLKGRD